MTGLPFKILIASLAALLLMGCAATAPSERREAVAISPPADDDASRLSFFPDRDLLDEGIALLRRPDLREPARARSVFATLLERYPQSRWRPAAETFIRLIDVSQAERDADRRTQLLTEQLLAERSKALQERGQLRKTIQELTEKLQTETAALAQENEQLKKDLQRLKTLEIELEKRERLLR